MTLASLEVIAEKIWVPFLEFVPNLLAAIILLIIGFIVGKVAGLVVREILIRTGADKYLKKEEHIKFKPSSVFDVITRWAIYITFITSAVDVLGIQSLKEIMTQIVYFIPQLVGAVIVILASYAIGVYIKDEILSAKTVYSDVLGKAIFFLIVYIGIAIALPIIRINTQLISNLLLIIVGSIGAGMAIAIGLGLKDIIREMAKDYAKDFREMRAKYHKKKKK